MHNGQIIPKMEDIILFRRAKYIELSSHVPFVTTEDGECEKNTIFQASVEPGALRFWVPTPLAVRYRQKKAQERAGTL